MLARRAQFPTQPHAMDLQAKNDVTTTSNVSNLQHHFFLQFMLFLQLGFWGLNIHSIAFVSFTGFKEQIMNARALSLLTRGFQAHSQRGFSTKRTRSVADFRPVKAKAIPKALEDDPSWPHFGSSDLFEIAESMITSKQKKVKKQRSSPWF